ncbi:polysaccharide deacetylase family protein [Siculibacillus lacustris]|uniref:Chitooligosaccharide deacetylase n=1 Tax=Siculibacillus lacustris TaxID=1549641 RepID=A0A4V2KSR5_9HYPH|nr:polysaccharide deacetylase family protein [Siculibacillus lacustris]TBW34056.1 polysaccharide deacetylase family protein [Siculibacillus lacustris]
MNGARPTLVGRLGHALASALAILAAALGTAGASRAAVCPRPDALGTARILSVTVGPEGLFVGTKNYPGTLALEDGEVVLTFDDGPAGRTTDSVLAALAAECVQATFFVVGQMAAQRPDQLRRIAAAGHTIGHHSMTHTILTTLSDSAARADVTRGWQTVDRILTGTARARPATPFFRFPGFAATRPLEDWLKAERVAVFGADFWGSDWNPSTPEALLARVLERIEARRRGILLLHDLQPHTAAMVPQLLRELKARGFRIVHLVPAG